MVRWDAGSGHVKIRRPGSHNEENNLPQLSISSERGDYRMNERARKLR